MIIDSSVSQLSVVNNPRVAISNEQAPFLPAGEIIDVSEEPNIIIQEEARPLRLQELFKRIHQLSRYPQLVEAEQIAQFPTQLNEALQREPCFQLAHFQTRIVQLRKMLSEVQKLPDAERLIFVLNQHLIHTEQAAKTLYHDSATPVQDSLWPLYERVLHLPTLEPDFFGAAVATLQERLPHAISNSLIEQLRELLPKLLPPAHYLWGQEAPFTFGLEKLEESKRASLVLLHRLKQAPEGHIKTFLEPMESIYETYRSYQEAFIKASDEKKIALCVPKAQLSGAGLSFFSLDQEVARTLVSRDERGKLCKKNGVGTHAVHCEAGVFYKPNSDQKQTYIHPEMEFAIYALYQRLGWHGVAPTALMKISHLFFEGQLDPQGRTLQAGYGIDGIPLQDLLDIANVIPMLTASLGEEKVKEAFRWLMKEDWQQEFIYAHPEFSPEALSSLKCDESAKRLLEGFRILFERRAPTKRCLGFSNLDSLDEMEKQFSTHISRQSPELLVGCLALLHKYSNLALTSSKDKQRFPPTGIHPISHEELIHLQWAMKKVKSLFPNHSADRLLIELPQLMNCFNRTDFSTHFVATLLTNPCDHRADNLMVTVVKNEQGSILSLSLVGIDNDLAFASSEGSIRTMLYLLEPMNSPFDGTVAKQVLGVTPEEFVLDWLIALEGQNQSYERWQQRGVVIEDGLDIPLKIDPLLIADVYAKTKQLREILETGSHSSHWEILKNLQPKLAKVYEKASNLGDTPMMAYSEIEGLFRKENLYPPPFEEDSASLISPKKAALQFLESVSLSSFPIKQQVSLMGKALRTFPSSASRLPLPGDPGDPSSRVDFFLMAVAEGHCALVARLLEEEKKSCLGKEEEESSSLIKVRNDEEQTALLLACLRLDLEMIQLLIHYKADPNVCDVRGQHIFSLCLTRFPQLPGQAATVIRFLAVQPMVFLNTTNKFLGWSLLHYLIHVAETAPEEAEPLIAYLIKKGANPDLVDNEGKSPLDYAIELGQERFVQQLIHLGAGRTLNVGCACAFFRQRPHLQPTFAFLQGHSLRLRWHLALEALRAISSGVNGSLHGVQLGQIQLSSDLINELLDKQGNICGQFEYGRRNVSKITVSGGHELYFKQYPEMPGVEYAIDTLFELLIGHGTSFTDLARLTPPNGKSYPVLISQGIKGENLHEVLADPIKAKRLDNLDPLHFSELLLASLLVNFEDAKPDNFILEQLPEGAYRLVGIDNDHAFVPPLVKKEGTTVQVKCILYCLDQMKQPLHPLARERFLSFTPERLLRLWLNRLIEQNHRYCTLFSERERGELFTEKKKHLGMVIPIPFKPGAIAAIYQKIQYLQTALMESDEITGMEVLRQVIPSLGIRYEEAFYAHYTPLDRFLSLVKTQYSTAIAGRLGTLLNSRQTLNSMGIPEKAGWKKAAEHGPTQALQELESLHQEIQASGQKLSKIRDALQAGNTGPFKALYLNTSKEKVIKGIRGVFEGIDFQKMKVKGQPDLKRQKKVLDIILRGNYRSFCIRGCSILNGYSVLDETFFNVLKKLVHGSPQLVSLELRNCTVIRVYSDSGSFPQNLQIYLQDLHYLTHLHLSTLPQVEELNLPHQTLRRVEIVACQGLKHLKISDTLKELSIEDCWNVSSIEAKIYGTSRNVLGMPLKYSRLEKEASEDFVLQRLRLKACPKLQPWWGMFGDWLKESKENEIELRKVPPNPNRGQSHILINAVLKKSDANEMMSSLRSFYKNDSSEDASSLGELYFMNSLNSLNLEPYGDTVDDRWLGMFASAFPGLTSVNLSGCSQITDLGISELSKGCSSLVDVNLSNCYQLTDACLPLLSLGCRDLTKVNLNHCGKIYSGIFDFVASCPNLTFLSVKGRDDFYQERNFIKEYSKIEFDYD